MSDITLTAGIRQNLLSLQQTSAELTSTQEALATGKSVNSAADNPSAFFTSQNLTNSANSLSSLLDQIGQGLQTIDAANNGLTSITSLLQQALSTVQQAQSDSWTTAASASGTVNLEGSAATGTVNLSATNAGTATGTVDVSTSTLTASTFTIATGGSTFTVSIAASEALSTLESSISTATDGAVTGTDDGSGHLVLSGANSFVVAANADVGLSAGTISPALANPATAGNVVIVSGGSSYTATLTASEALSSIESGINTATGGAVTATDDGNGHLVLQADQTGFTVNYSSTTNSLGITSGTQASTATASKNTGTNLSAGTLLLSVGSTNYSVSVSAGASLSQIESDINNTTGLGSTGALSATDDGAGHLVLTSNSGPNGFTVNDNTFAESLGLTTAGNNNSPDGTSTARTTLQANYNGLLKQINQLSSDSGYNGVNLLGGDNLTINFNSTGTSSLTITGVDFNAQGLGLSSISASAGTGSFQDDTSLSSLVSGLNTAISNVQSQTETFGTNSSTISTRQTFTTNMINTLQTGASNLVAADQNQESANLLTEQTQQQLEISALSIANQANQSVLKLFG